MQYIAPSIHKLIKLKLQQILVKRQHLDIQMNIEGINTPEVNKSNNDIAELQEMQITLDQLFNLYQSRKTELKLLSEKYLDFQQKVRIKLRKQQILNKKHNKLFDKKERA